MSPCCSRLLYVLPGFAQFILKFFNLPIVVINTNGQDIPDDPQISADMGIIYNGEGQRNNLTDPFNEYNAGKIAIEIRGQSSQMFPMKSYSVDLKNVGQLRSTRHCFWHARRKRLGIVCLLYRQNPDAQRTCLLRWQQKPVNGATLSLCRAALNGDYRVNLCVAGKIKRGKTGDISKIKVATDLSGDDNRRLYLQPRQRPMAGIGTPSNRQFSYVYPKLADIKDEQAAYLKSYGCISAALSAIASRP